MVAIGQRLNLEGEVSTGSDSDRVNDSTLNIRERFSVAAPRLNGIKWSKPRLAQSLAQSLALGLALTAAPQLPDSTI